MRIIDLEGNWGIIYMSQNAKGLLLTIVTTVPRWPGVANYVVVTQKGDG